MIGKERNTHWKNTVVQTGRESFWNAIKQQDKNVENKKKA